jgi:iron complex transport system ATP-binding protein
LSTLLFSLHNAGMRYDGTDVLRHTTLDFLESQMVTIVGPNGAGKSTLLGIMAGLRPSYGGRCLYRGIEVRSWPRRDFAREVAFVPQSVRIEFPFTAEQVVMMGRTPHCDGLFESPEDREAAERAMRFTDMLAFRSRDFRSLSGGEKQRAILASVLAQSPRALLLDEPTTFLDLQHQLAIYRLLRDLARQGLLVVSVTHDLNLAATFSDRVIMLRAGEVAYDAAPATVLRPETIRQVFEIEAEIRQGREGKPWILYGD